MANRIQLRRDLAANWTSANPILAQGEPGFEVDTDKLKIGDGITHWVSLAYIPVGTVLSVTATGPIISSGGSNPNISLGTVPIANGGTGQTTANAGFNALSPMTTAGDIIYENATPIAARLPIGSSGQLLTVSGGVPVWATPATNGTVTSVALTVPSILTVSGSPITTSGTLAVTLANETANTVFAGPTSGGAATPTFRSLVPADVPTLNQNTTGTASNITASSNSTLTTLSALSLPGSQVTGNISGNAANVTGVVAVANGGTGDSSFTANQIILGGTTTTGPLAQVPGATSGFILTSNGTTAAPTFQAPATNGTVTSVSVVSANGFAGTVANPTTTPAITLSTTLNTPVIAGNGTALIAATTTGTGSTVVLATSPTLITPNLGTPSAITLTNATGLPLTTGITGVLPIANGGTNNSSAYTAGSVIFSNGTSLTQDNANFFWNDTNFSLGLGTNTPGAATFIDAVNVSGATKRLLLTGYGSGSLVGMRGRLARGTSGSPTAVQTGDILSFFNAEGYGTSQFPASGTGAITFIAGENFTNTSNQTYVTINATATGTTSSVEAMRVTATGVTLGPQSGSTAIHQDNGGLQGTTRTTTTNLTIDTTTTDYIIFCNQSGAITLTLPTPTNGRILIIKDVSGTANTNNIILARHASELIEGIAASKILQTNYGSWTFTSDGTNWWMI